MGNPNYFGTLADTPFQPIEKIASARPSSSSRASGSTRRSTSSRPSFASTRRADTAGHCATRVRASTCASSSATTGARRGRMPAWTPSPCTTPAGARPLDFAVNVVAPLNHYWCLFARPALVRAILSWNVAPTAGDPDYTPVWGNVVTVSVAPRTASSRRGRSSSSRRRSSCPRRCSRRSIWMHR